MSHRYRLCPTPEQEVVMRMHCDHARKVWNTALTQCMLAERVGQYADQQAWDRQLAEARQSMPWLAAGSSTVQQQALRDLRQAFKNWWSNPGHFGRPTWRKEGKHEGFRLVGYLPTRRLTRRYAEVAVPKAGRVRFRLSRPVPEGTRSARVTLDRSGRWHVSFGHIPMQIDGPDDGTIVGIDRGVVIPYQCSDGRRWDMPGLNEYERRRLRLLQRRMARQQKGSKRREQTRIAIAKLRARDAARRKDVIEKATTELARTADIVRIENLPVEGMTRSGKGTVEKPGKNVRQQAGQNREVRARGWAMFAERLGDKIGDRLELVPRQYTSQRCHKCGYTARENRDSQADFRCKSCGHTDNADVNAALNIAAGYAVTARGGCGAMRPPDEARTTRTTAGTPLPSDGDQRLQPSGIPISIRLLPASDYLDLPAPADAEASA